MYAIFIKSRGFKDLKYYICCLLVMTKTKTKSYIYQKQWVQGFKISYWLSEYWTSHNLLGLVSFSFHVQTVAGEKVEGQGGRRTRTSSVSSTSSRWFSHLKSVGSISPMFRDGGVPQSHRGFLQPRLRDQAPSKVSFFKLNEMIGVIVWWCGLNTNN